MNESYEKKGSYLFYHGTTVENLELIQLNGLRGGDDFDSRSEEKGDKAILHLTPDFETAEKYGQYGNILQIRLTKKELSELGLRPSINHAGELEYYIDDLEWNEIIIRSENLTNIAQEWKDGTFDYDNPYMWRDIDEAIQAGDKKEINEWIDFISNDNISKIIRNKMN